MWRKLRAQVLAEEPICYIRGCGRASTQVDHVVPLKVRPDLGLERDNLRGICARHNAQKGARVPQVERHRPKPTAPNLEPCARCGYPIRHYCL